MEDIEKINKTALEKVCLAQKILDKIKLHPELKYVQDKALYHLRTSNWNNDFVLNTLDEVALLYNANCYNDIKDEKDVPAEVKKFFLDGIGYKFFDGRN